MSGPVTRSPPPPSPGLGPGFAGTAHRPLTGGASSLPTPPEVSHQTQKRGMEQPFLPPTSWGVDRRHLSPLPAHLPCDLSPGQWSALEEEPPLRPAFALDSPSFPQQYKGRFSHVPPAPMCERHVPAWHGERYPEVQEATCSRLCHAPIPRGHGAPAPQTSQDTKGELSHFSVVSGHSKLEASGW